MNRIYIVLMLAFFPISCIRKENIRFESYFIDSEKDNLNYRLFESINDSLHHRIIIRQIIKPISEDKIEIEYHWMNEDSIPFLQGKEMISNYSMEFLESSIFEFDTNSNQTTKIKATSKNNIFWNLMNNKNQSFNVEYKNDWIDYQVKSSVTAIFKDTLGTKCLILYGNEKTKIIQENSNRNYISISKRIYKLNKGLIYFNQTVNDDFREYYLLE